MRRFLSSLRSLDAGSALVFALWQVFFATLWLYSRLFPRIPTRVLFWTNQGYHVAPSRLRSYFFCREMRRRGADAHILSFWEHLLGYDGLLPVKISMFRRTFLLLQAVTAAIRSRAGIIAAQAPLYDVLSLACLKLLYPRSLTIWVDVDDWLFDVSMDNTGATVNLRSVIPLHGMISEGCVVSSLPLQNEMPKYFKRVELIPTFPDATMFAPGHRTRTRGDEVVFAWTGTFLMRHVVDDAGFLVDAFELIPYARARLELVGDGIYLEQAKNRASGNAVRARVRFLGWMNPADIPEYLRSIDVGLYCLSERTDFALSKSPTKLFEYMACGLPTVCTDVGEAPRFIEHGVTGFIAKDVESFAECCMRLIDDPELRLRMGAAARKRVEEEYNIRASGAKLERILFGPRRGRTQAA
jgi:glycosyltransferase involved in cell wall biosynthesis